MLSYEPNLSSEEKIKILRKSTMCFITMDPNHILQQQQELLPHAP
jgi:hypothetical protein